MESVLQKSFDNLLEIKPNYGYARILEKRQFYTDVRLKLDISMTYVTEHDTFLRTLFLKIKQALDGRGYFTRNVLLGKDYNFSIIFDYLDSETLYQVFCQIQGILQFSRHLLYLDGDENSPIHLYFSKREVFDFSKMHQRLLSFVYENNHFFGNQVTKQLPLLWHYQDYLKQQVDIMGKYATINYLNEHMIEIRNIKKTISPLQLREVMRSMLALIYQENLSYGVRRKLLLGDEKLPTIYPLFQRLFEGVFTSRDRFRLEKMIKEEELLVFSLSHHTPLLVSSSNKKVVPLSNHPFLSLLK